MSPLSSCSRLKVIDVSENKLKRVNLAPLSECDMLKRVNLRRNKLEVLDTWSIASLYKSGVIVSW